MTTRCRVEVQEKSGFFGQIRAREISQRVDGARRGYAAYRASDASAAGIMARSARTARYVFVACATLAATLTYPAFAQESAASKPTETASQPKVDVLPPAGPTINAAPSTNPDLEPYQPEPMSPFGASTLTGGKPSTPTVLSRPTNVRGDDGTLPIPDRWRVGLPNGYVQNRDSAGILDPYNQNVLKGDYPILGQDWFLIVTAVSDTLFEGRRLYIPSGVSAASGNRLDFFGGGDQFFFNQNFIFSVEFFEGNTVYKPRDIEFKMTLVENLNYVNVQENNIVYPDPGQGQDRFDEHLAFQELFVDKHLADLSVNYDFIAVRAGIQGFNADFRGFLFNDNEPGIRLLGNFDNNKLIYNLAYFHTLEKDTNSGLNTLNARGQDVIIANLYREDFLWEGYTAQVLFAANFDYTDTQYDENGFLVRPQPIGTISEKENKVFYLGWAGDGHIGWLNISHQFYQALGTESFNPIAGQGTNINAQFFSLELSVDHDWQRYRASFAYASGDRNPTDGNATGFDSIFENPNFAGGGFSYFVRQGIPLTGGGTGLVGRNGILPDLRTSKDQGQANFVNPGLLLYNVGADFDVTPRTKVITNLSYLQFAEPQVLRQLLFDDKIGRDIGIDISVGVQYRPLNTQNIILTAGAAALIPAQGFKDIYTSDTLYSVFLSATLTY
jgi:hypothetical protein